MILQVSISSGQDLRNGGEQVGLVKEGMICWPEFEGEAGDGSLL